MSLKRLMANADAGRIGLATGALALVLSAGPLAATNWTVQTGGGTCASPGDLVCGTLQQAVDAAAASGDTIDITAGTFTEQVTITKSLTITGATAATSIIKSPDVLNPDSDGQRSIIRVSGASTVVTISKVTVTGPVTSNCGGINNGLYAAGGATLNLNNSIVTEIHDTPLGGCQNGIGIRLGVNAFGQVGKGTVDSNTFTVFQKAGVVVDGTGSNGTVTNNIITGVGPTVVIAQDGIQISRGATGSAASNTVTACECDHPSCSGSFNQAQASAILFFNAGANVSASNNILNNNDKGIYSSSTAPTTIANNTITNNRFEGVFLDQGTANVSGNLIQNNAWGLVVGAFLVADGTSANSIGNVFTNQILGNTVTGVSVYDKDLQDAFEPNLNAHHNRIFTNVAGITANTTAPEDVQNNWFGCNGGPNTVGCDTVTGGNLDFNPWLVLGITIAPNPVTAGQNATVTSSLAKNSDGVDTTGIGAVPKDITVSWTTAPLGTVNPTTRLAATLPFTSGLSTTTFNSAVAGQTTVCTTVDNAQVCLQLNINPVPVELQTFDAE